MWETRQGLSSDAEPDDPGPNLAPFWRWLGTRDEGPMVCKSSTSAPLTGRDPIRSTLKSTQVLRRWQDRCEEAFGKRPEPSDRDRLAAWFLAESDCPTLDQALETIERIVKLGVPGRGLFSQLVAYYEWSTTWQQVGTPTAATSRKRAEYHETMRIALDHAEGRSGDWPFAPGHPTYDIARDLVVKHFAHAFMEAYTVQPPKPDDHAIEDLLRRYARGDTALVLRMIDRLFATQLMVDAGIGNIGYVLAWWDELVGAGRYAREMHLNKTWRKTLTAVARGGRCRPAGAPPVVIEGKGVTRRRAGRTGGAA